MHDGIVFSRPVQDERVWRGFNESCISIEIESTQLDVKHGALISGL